MNVTPELRKLRLENRISVLTNKDPVVNAKIIKKLNRQLNNLNAATK